LQKIYCTHQPELAPNTLIFFTLLVIFVTSLGCKDKELMLAILSDELLLVGSKTTLTDQLTDITTMTCSLEIQLQLTD